MIYNQWMCRKINPMYVLIKILKFFLWIKSPAYELSHRPSLKLSGWRWGEDYCRPCLVGVHIKIPSLNAAYIRLYSFRGYIPLTNAVPDKRKIFKLGRDLIYSLECSILGLWTEKIRVYKMNSYIISFWSDENI